MATRKSPFPRKISPMLATLVDKPFDEPGWIYEIKWDGYRAIGMIHKGQVHLISRNNKSFNEKFYPVTAALKKWKINAVVDGEVAVLNDKGTPVSDKEKRTGHANDPGKKKENPKDGNIGKNNAGGYR